MSIKRAPRPDGNFYVLDKRISEDDRLSWAARGLLIFLLGKPDHWEVSVQHLVIQTADAIGKSSKRDAVYSILKELSQAGYLVRQRGRGESGEFGKVDYIVTETPVEGDPLTDNPDVVDSPYTDNPDTDKPDTANPTLVSTEGLVTTEAPVSNENNPIGPSPSDDAPAEVSTDDAFEVFWHAGMRKANKKKARAAFGVALKAAGQVSTPQAFAETLAADVMRRAAAEQMGFDKMHPTTYLNGERWEDELPAKQSQAGRQDGRKGFAQPMEVGSYTPTNMNNLPDWAADLGD